MRRRRRRSCRLKQYDARPWVGWVTSAHPTADDLRFARRAVRASLLDASHLEKEEHHAETDLHQT
jgi:hypothetical protein